jgi:sialate O-acetylesterase
VVRIGKPEDRTVDIEFDNVVGGLRSVGPAHGFIFITPAGDPTFVVHRVTLKGDTSRLHLNDPLPEGARLTYGCGTAPICNVVDGRGMAVPMFGPVSFQPIKRSLLPFMTEWLVSDAVTNGGSLAEAAAPDFKTLAAQPRSYSSRGFIDEHERWVNRNGLGFFRGFIKLSEPMTLRFLMGYDGPFRLWLNGEPFFTDLEGVNPCLPDKAEKAVELKQGVHEIQIGMDLARGRSWGFFLRFARRDITPKQRARDEYAKPVYLSPA